MAHIEKIYKNKMMPATYTGYDKFVSPSKTRVGSAVSTSKGRNSTNPTPLVTTAGMHKVSNILYHTRGSKQTDEKIDKSELNFKSFETRDELEQSKPPNTCPPT